MMNKNTRIHTLELGPMDNFIYLIEDTDTQQAAVVDPAWDAQEILNLAKQKGLRITDILLTHSHTDHINAIEGVLDQHDAKIHLTHAEAKFWGQTALKPHLHHGGDSFNLGETQINILHTPGHTPGSACYHINDQLITGDTMFVFGCGRCDMAGGDPNIMFDTLSKLKNELPQETTIRPGHNYAIKPTATMSEQCSGNPFMHFDQVDDFVKFRMHLHGQVRTSPYEAVNAQCTHDWVASST